MPYAGRRSVVPSHSSVVFTLGAVGGCGGRGGTELQDPFCEPTMRLCQGTTWVNNKMSKSWYLDCGGVRTARTWAVLFHPAPRQASVGLVAVPHRLGDECAGLVAHGRRRVAAVINSGLALGAVRVPLHACSSHGIQRIVGGRDGSLPSRIVADQTLARRYRHSRGAFPLRPLHHCKRVNLRVRRLTERFRVLWPMF